MLMPARQHGRRSPRAFTMPEVIVSLVILTMGIVSATTLVSYLLRSTRVTREELAAVNLAREGLEAFRNVRDTNWQANSGSQRDAEEEAREHWHDGFDDPEVYAQSVGATPVVMLPLLGPAEVGSTQPAWSLQMPGTAGCTAGALDTPEKRSQLYRETATGRFIHTCAAVAANDPALTPTRYRRELRVRYLNTTDPTQPATVDPDIGKAVWVEATVRWYASPDAALWTNVNEQGNVRMETVLTDWFGRKDKPAP